MLYQNEVLLPIVIPLFQRKRSTQLMQDGAEVVLVFRDMIITEWNRIPQQLLHNFILSIRQRYQSIIRANGGHAR